MCSSHQQPGAVPCNRGAGAMLGAAPPPLRGTGKLRANPASTGEHSCRWPPQQELCWCLSHTQWPCRATQPAESLVRGMLPCTLQCCSLPALMGVRCVNCPEHALPPDGAQSWACLCWPQLCACLQVDLISPQVSALACRCDLIGPKVSKHPSSQGAGCHNRKHVEECRIVGCLQG